MAYASSLIKIYDGSWGISLYLESPIAVCPESNVHCFGVSCSHPMQDNATDEIVIKAMGRAINKTVVIVELLKVELLLNKTTF